MKIKRLVTAAFGAATCAVVLASCGETKTDDAHTIVFYHTMGDSLQEVLDTAIDEFEAKFPGWTITSTQVGGYDDVKNAIVGDLSAGTQPDLAYCYADHVAQYIQTGKVVDMTKFINRTDEIDVKIVSEDADGNTVTTDGKEVVGYTQAEINDFVKGYYSEGLATNYASYDTYGYASTAMLTLPFVKSTEVLYYNKTALTAAGLEVPTTWDELWAACEVLHTKYPTCTPLGYDSEANWFITMCEQNGWGYTSASGNHYTFKNDGTIAWLTDLQDKFDKNLYTTQNIYGSYTSNLFVKGAEDGGSVFSIGSSGGASHQAPTASLFDWGVAPMPGSVVNGNVVRKAISQGPSLCMFETEYDNSEEKQLMTWEFVKMIETPEFQCSFAMKSGYNPSRVSSAEVAEYKKFLSDETSIVAVTAKVASQMVNDYFTSPAFIGSSVARTQVGTALQYAVTGQKSPEKALSDALNKCGA